MEGKTGTKVVLPGIYKCKEHPDATRTYARGSVFVACGRAGGHGTTWVLVRKTG